MPTRSAVDPDRLAELEEERRFLLRSLNDLEREYRAGDIDEVLLVLDGTTGQNAMEQARTFTNAVGVTGIVITKLDGTARGGMAIAVEEELGVPVKYIGVGEGMDDLVPFEPDASLIRPFQLISPAMTAVQNAVYQAHGNHAGQEALDFSAGFFFDGRHPIS